VREVWQIIAEEPGEARDAVSLLTVMTERLRYVEWPTDEDDLIHGTPMFERIAASAERERRSPGVRHRLDVPQPSTPERGVANGDCQRPVTKASAVR
jgi:hypothetical protein